MDKRPIGSRDWNHNGEYDFFDKVTDRYVYEKVSNYKPEPKPPKEHQQTSNDCNDDGKKHIFAWIVAFFIHPMVLISILIELLICFMGK